MSELRSWTFATIFSSILLSTSIGYATTDIGNEVVVGIPHGIQARLFNNAFDELEAISGDYRSSHARIVGGRSALMNIYDILSRIEGGNFDKKRSQLELWQAQKPNSLTARIALSLLWQKYAWEGRGGDIATNTTKEQFDIFEERMTQSLRLIESLDPNVDPEIYSIKLEATPIYDQPRAQMLALYDRATRAFPYIMEYAASRAHFSRPRWYGDTDEFRQFSQSLLKNPGGKLGKMEYFKIAGNSLQIKDGVLDLAGASYSSILDAYYEIDTYSGMLPYDRNVMLYYAIAANDMRTADQLAKQIGNEWYAPIWSDDNDEITRIRKSKWP